MYSNRKTSRDVDVLSNKFQVTPRARFEQLSTGPSKQCSWESLLIQSLPSVIAVLGLLIYGVILVTLDFSYKGADHQGSLKKEVEEYVDAKVEREDQEGQGEDGTVTSEREPLEPSRVSSISSLHNLCCKIAKSPSLSLGRRNCCFWFPFWFPGRRWDGRKYVKSVITDELSKANPKEDIPEEILTIPHIKRKLKQPTTTPAFEGAQLAIVCKAIRLKQEQIVDRWTILLEIFMFIVANMLTNVAFWHFSCIPDLLTWYPVVYTTGDLVSKVPIKSFLDWWIPNFAREMESVVRELKVRLEQKTCEECDSGLRDRLWLSTYFGVYQEVTDALEDSHTSDHKCTHLVRFVLWLLPPLFRLMGILTAFYRHTQTQPPTNQFSSYGSTQQF